MVQTAKTAESPQLQFICGRRLSLRYAEADSYGPAVDRGDFAVAVRVGWSLSLVCSREFRSCSSSSWSSSPLSLRRVYPMVQTVRQTWDSPVAVQGGRRSCCAGRARSLPRRCAEAVSMVV